MLLLLFVHGGGLQVEFHSAMAAEFDAANVCLILYVMF